MEKQVTISNKIYNMKSSAITQFSYKNETGRSLLKDLTELLKYQDKEKIKKMKINEQLIIYDEVQELIFKISYVMIKEYDKAHNSNQVMNYEEYLSNIDSFNEESYIPILELACNPLSGQLPRNK